VAVAIVAKEAATMAFMEDTAQGFSEGISGIDFSWEVAKKEVSGLAPFLDGKPLDVDVTSPFGWLAIVDDIYARFVVFKNESRFGGGKTEFSEDRTEVTTDFSTLNGSKKFGLGRAGGDNRLGFNTEGDGGARHDEGVASSGTFGAEIISMGSINNGEGFHKISRFWIKG
jgi:hypothetical protein